MSFNELSEDVFANVAPYLGRNNFSKLEPYLSKQGFQINDNVRCKHQEETLMKLTGRDLEGLISWFQMFRNNIKILVQQQVDDYANIGLYITVDEKAMEFFIDKFSMSEYEIVSKLFDIIFVIIIRDKDLGEVLITLEDVINVYEDEEKHKYLRTEVENLQPFKIKLIPSNVPLDTMEAFHYL